MARSLWELFTSLIQREGKDGGQENGGFVPSPLDLSIRVSHGGPDDDVERELHKIEKQAQELEEEQRDH